MVIKNKSFLTSSIAKHSAFLIADPYSYSSRENERRDWSARCQFETLDCFSNKGCVVLSCLTYEKRFRPRMVLPDGTFMDAFSYEHIRNYTHSIQSFLNDRGILNGYRYFVACEYGESTGHPHYHVLNFFSNEAASLIAGFRYDGDTLKLKEQTFKDFLASFWPHGMLRWTKARSVGGLGIFLTSIIGSTYAAKYVCKSLSFEDAVKIHCGSDIQYKIFKHENRNFWPRHYQSLRFGFYMLKDVSFEALVEGLFVSDLFTGKVNKVIVPRYLSRTKTHKLDKDLMVWRITELGRQVVNARISKRMKSYNDFILSFKLGEIPFENFAEFDNDVFQRHLSVLMNASLQECVCASRYHEIRYIAFEDKDVFDTICNSSGDEFVANVDDFLNLFYGGYFASLFDADGKLPTYCFRDCFPLYSRIDDAFNYMSTRYSDFKGKEKEDKIADSSLFKGKLYGEI